MALQSLVVPLPPHALRQQLSDRMLAIFETGVRYQMYHALALLAVSVVLQRAANRVILANGSGMGLHCWNRRFFR